MSRCCRPIGFRSLFAIWVWSVAFITSQVSCSKDLTLPSEWSKEMPSETLVEVNRRVSGAHRLGVRYESNNDVSTMVSWLAHEMRLRGWSVECRPRRNKRGLRKGDRRIVFAITKSGTRIIVDVTDSQGDLSGYNSVWTAAGRCR